MRYVEYSLSTEYDEYNCTGSNEVLVLSISTSTQYSAVVMVDYEYGVEIQLATL
jgi:hypothetical protein